jgi:hypothetical protein
MSAANAVRDRLLDQPLPGEADAAARSWPVVEAALAERRAAETSAPAARGVRRPLVRVVLAAALLGAGLAAALSPAGAAVGDWVGDRFAGGGDRAEPAFAPLPESGAVLAIARGGAYAISADGSTQGLGSFTEAGWSPHGEHVVGVDGRRLVAVTPTGAIKWTLVEPHPVRGPAWSTRLGYAVAYLEGHSLRVVAGDGDPTTNRLLRRDARPVRPAWRPRSDRVLSYAASGGVIATVDVETGRTRWRTDLPTTSAGAEATATLRTLAWSRSGRRLVALTSHSVTVLNARGRVVRTLPVRGVARELALDPSGRRAAVVAGRGQKAGVFEVSLAGGAAPGADRRVFQGDVDGIAWSRNGRRLLVGWRGADQWLLLGPGRRIRALHGVTRELGAAGGFPRVVAWCCGG